MALLSVRDTGEGIAPELLDSVFAPFIQGKMGLDRGPGGLGLGLALVRGRRVLIIEDNADIAETMLELVHAFGHRAWVAESGQRGLTLARELCPDVVLCDIGLPGTMNGYDVARALRAEIADGSAQFVALTGYGREEDRRRALEAGFDLHLTNPVDPALLERILGTPGGAA